MTGRVAIDTGLRGPGCGMAPGLAQAGIPVLAVGYLAESVATAERMANMRPPVANIRHRATSDGAWQKRCPRPGGSISWSTMAG